MPNSGKAASSKLMATGWRRRLEIWKGIVEPETKPRNEGTMVRVGCQRKQAAWSSGRCTAKTRVTARIWLNNMRSGQTCPNHGVSI